MKDDTQRLKFVIGLLPRKVLGNLMQYSISVAAEYGRDVPDATHQLEAFRRFIDDQIDATGLSSPDYAGSDDVNGDDVFGIHTDSITLKSSAVIIKSKAISKMIGQDGMTPEEAEEFWDYNVAGSYGRFQFSVVDDMIERESIEDQVKSGELFDPQRPELYTVEEYKANTSTFSCCKCGDSGCGQSEKKAESVKKTPAPKFVQKPVAKKPVAPKSTAKKPVSPAKKASPKKKK
jgi:hypothetical protein